MGTPCVKIGGNLGIIGRYFWANVKMGKMGKIGKRKNIDSILPGKLYEYMGTTKPILACVPEGAAKLALNEYPASFVCEPDNVDQIKETIIKLFDLYKRNEFPSVDEGFLVKYRRDFLTEQLAKQMNSILKV